MASSSTDWTVEADFRYCCLHNIVHNARILCPQCGLRLKHANGSLVSFPSLQCVPADIVRIYADFEILLNPPHIPGCYDIRPPLHIPITQHARFLDNFI